MKVLKNIKKLKLLKTEDKDTFQLRPLFADKIAEGHDELLAFLPFENNDGGIEAKVGVRRVYVGPSRAIVCFKPGVPSPFLLRYLSFKCEEIDNIKQRRTLCHQEK